MGCFLVAGGLVGLAILPSAHLSWTVAPQALVGLGLGLTVDQLTSQAMHLRLPRVEHASWTISARHLGVVVGLAILTPVFVGDLQEAQVPAQEAITSLVLDAPLTAQDKVSLAQALGDELSDQQGEVPDLHRAFAAADFGAGRSSGSGQARARPRRPAGARRDPGLPRLVPRRRRPGDPRPAHRDRAAQAEGPMNRHLRAASLPAVALGLVSGVLADPAGVRRRDLRAAATGRPLRRADRHLAVRGDRGTHRAARAHRRRRRRLQPGRQPRGVHARARRSGDPTDAEIDALREGLLSAVDRDGGGRIAASGVGAGRRGARLR